MKKEDIQTKIDVIFNNLDKLKFFKAKSYEEFINFSIPHSLCCGETLNPLLKRGFGGF